ncbi:MAG: CBS domain-containing protein [Chloroflexi bacterium]|nr:CBS domain-containing protein [Chloroflexota bacterium]
MRSPLGIPIARIFGIEIRVQLGWAFVLSMVAFIAVGQLNAVDPSLEDAVAWLLGGIVAFGFFISSVSHDLAHAVVARRRGIDVKSIAVSFFGGATPMDPSSPDPGDDAAIAASGPLASLAIGALCFAAMAGLVAATNEFTAAAGVLAVLVFLNLVLGLVNLVPAYPLDGGRIVRDLAWRRSGSERSGWRAAWRSGRFTGLVVIGIGAVFLVSQGDMTGAFIALTGWFFILSSNSVRDRIRLDDLVGTHVVRDAMEDAPATVHPGLTVDTFAAQLLDGESPMTAVPVVEGASIVGIIGIAQIRRIRRSEWPNTRVADVMAKPPKLTFLAPTEPLRQALERIYKAGIDGLPVMEEGHLLGVLTKRGIGRFVHERSEQAKEPVPQDPTPPTP